MSKLMMHEEWPGLSPEEKAKKAISHTLNQICDNPALGWYCGVGTGVFHRLTEALAALIQKPVAEVREDFLPEGARDPRIAGYELAMKDAWEQGCGKWEPSIDIE